MIKRMMGFLESYSLGFAPSRMPPWGVTRAAVEDAAGLVVVVVTSEDIVEDMVAEEGHRDVVVLYGGYRAPPISERRGEIDR
jgi:hypothetical protein